MEDTTERVDVGTCVDVVALDLLRRDVVDGADHSRCAGRVTPSPARCVSPKSARYECSASPCPLIRMLEGASVDQPSRVRGVERVGDLAEQLHRRAGLSGPSSRSRRFRSLSST